MTKERKGETGKEKLRRSVSASFITGAIALVFLIVGFQTALFFGKVRQNRLAAKELAALAADSSLAPASDGAGGDDIVAESGGGDHRSDTYNNRSAYNKGAPSGGNHSAPSGGNYNKGSPNGKGKPPKRTVENFRFDPNTATVEEFVRLGFTEKQAQSIENYRLKGGKFRRKSDFAKSFVVADSVYRRLEPYIDIPLLDLNVADSAAFTSLPGIGGYFAAKMVEHRTQLGGYSYKEQLMDIYRFDGEKFGGLEDLVFVNPSNVRPYPLWTLPEDSLARHPYIGTYAAHGIVLFRENSPREEWTVENLDKAGILREGMGEKLARCVIADNY
ncbi:MAG: helix-hairpin-helix domain-containing protein [Bacteroidales bacterium]|nr:helix-hairpin-helix domain-containing protein [Bacteroidales bacterium]